MCIAFNVLKQFLPRLRWGVGWGVIYVWAMNLISRLKRKGTVKLRRQNVSIGLMIRNQGGGGLSVGMIVLGRTQHQ